MSERTRDRLFAACVAYRGGHGVDARLGTALANVSLALFVSSWLLAA